MIDQVLIVDDDFLIRDLLEETLRRNDITPLSAGSGEEALELIERRDFQMAFVDLKMRKLSGLDVLKTCVKRRPQALIVIMTAYGTVEKAVEAMKVGAFDFVTKPFTPDHFEVLLRKASDWLALNERHQFYQKQAVDQRGEPSNVLGSSPAFKNVMALAAKVAPTNSTVLITGESGTGKEVVASEIQRMYDPTGKRPYIKVNCAAIPETIIESELFGHEKGAFTGAEARRIGRFELAEGGTLLLDEIGEVSPRIQAKLLRVLQESEFERVGGDKTLKVNVRVIATTNRDLRAEVADGRFREDLFFRLNVFPIHIPPLRERGDDVVKIANAILRRQCASLRKTLRFNDDVLKRFQSYRWPGNVRELENLIERLGILAENERIDASLLPLEISHGVDVFQGMNGIGEDYFHVGEIEKMLVMKALSKENGNKTKAAERLGLSVRTLHNKLNKWTLPQAPKIEESVYQ